MRLKFATGAVLACLMAEARESITGVLTHLCTDSRTNARGDDQVVSKYVSGDFA